MADINLNVFDRAFKELPNFHVPYAPGKQILLEKFPSSPRLVGRLNEFASLGGVVVLDEDASQNEFRADTYTIAMSIACTEADRIFRAPPPRTPLRAKPPRTSLRAEDEDAPIAIL